MKLTAAEIAAVAAALVFAGAAVGSRTAGGDGYTISTGEDAPAVVSVSQAPAEETPLTEFSPVNINTADAAELDSLPGIGEVLAARVIEYRERHGPFETVDDVVAVEGIGEATLKGLRELITVG